MDFQAIIQSPPSSSTSSNEEVEDIETSMIDLLIQDGAAGLKEDSSSDFDEKVQSLVKELGSFQVSNTEVSFNAKPALPNPILASSVSNVNTLCCQQSSISSKTYQQNEAIPGNRRRKRGRFSSDVVPICLPVDDSQKSVKSMKIKVSNVKSNSFKTTSCRETDTKNTVMSQTEKENLKKYLQARRHEKSKFEATKKVLCLEITKPSANSQKRDMDEDPLEGTSQQFSDTYLKTSNSDPTDRQKILYVGGLPEGFTNEFLQMLFLRYGLVENVSFFTRSGICNNYGFVTFKNTDDAAKVLSSYKCDPVLKSFNICYGGRRAFCKRAYSDLDSESSEDSGISSPQLDFDRLLAISKAKLVRKE